MASKSFSISELHLVDGNMAENWKRWKLMLQGPLADKDKKQQRGYFLLYIGQQARNVYNTWAFKSAEKDKIVKMRDKFNTRVQRSNENIDQYVTELRRLAKDCAYGDLAAEMIRDRIVCGTSDARVQGKLLQAETLDLPKAINIARGIEISTHQMKDLAEESDKTVHAMNKSRRKWQKSNNAKSKSRQEKDPESAGLYNYVATVGVYTEHLGKQACPAKG